MDMLYHIHELKNAALWPTHLASEATQLILNVLDPNHDKDLYTRFLSASSEMVERTTRIYTKPDFGIIEADRKGTKLAVKEEHYFVRPFCRLKHFVRQTESKKVSSELKNDPIVLIIAPLSGHFATLLRDTARAMIPYHDTYITDWSDARIVPMEDGEFTLETYIDYLLDFIRGLHQQHQGRRLHIIAVCQPAVPVLVAASLLASYHEPCQPLSMTLMGGPIDTRINPGKVNDFAKNHSLKWFERNIISKVPIYFKGAGRKVCPGFVLLGGFMHLNLDRHGEATLKHFEHLIKGDMESAEVHRSFYDEYRAVLDVPAPYFLDSMKHAFQEHTLPLGNFTWRGYKVDPAAIQDTGLLTVEGELDDISCPGQTYAAHDLCKNLPKSRKKAILQEGVGHYGIFNGRRWRTMIQPKVAEFIRENEKIP